MVLLALSKPQAWVGLYVLTSNACTAVYAVVVVIVASTAAAAFIAARIKPYI